MLNKLYGELDNEVNISNVEFEDYKSYNLYNDTIEYKLNMSRNEEERKRFRMYDNRDDFNIGSRWGTKLSFINDLLRIKDKEDKKNRTNILKKCVEMAFGKKNIGKIEKYDEELELKIKIKFGEIGRYFKVMGNENKYIEQIGVNGYLDFINMEMLGDYAPDDLEQASQGLDTWLLIEKDIKGDEDFKKLFYTLFDEYIDDFFVQNEKFNMEKRTYTFKEYVNDVTLWATDGSSGASIKMIKEWKQLKGSFRNTKKIFGLLMNKEELYHKCLNVNEQVLKVNIKRELVKSRGVVNSDIYTYLLMSYMSYMCESTLYNTQKSSLFLKNNQSKKIFYSNIIEGLEENQEYFVPIDQSSFDANVNHNMVRRCFNGYKKYCMNFNYKENDIEMILNKMEKIITKGKVQAYGKEFEFKNGIPSGWRWTSMFDSAINYAQTKALEKIMNMMGQPIIIKNLMVQGDDVNCTIEGKKSAEMLVIFFNHIGLTTNRRKMFISKDRTEYLRVQYILGDKIEMIGLPVRSVPSLFCRSPLATDLMSLNSLIDQFTKIGRRFKIINNKEFQNIMYSDFVGYVNNYSDIKINVNHIKNYISLDSRFGGYGMQLNEEEDNFMVIIKERVVKESREDIENKRKIMINIMENENDVRNLIENARYINEELEIYGEMKKKRIKVKIIRRYDSGGKNKCIASPDIRKRIKIKSELSNKKKIPEQIHFSYDDNGRKRPYDKQSLYYIINVNRREKLVEDNAMKFVRKKKINEFFEFHDKKINKSERWMNKLLAATKAFQARYLLRNEDFINKSKTLDLGQSMNGVILDLVIKERVQYTILVSRWTTFTLSNIQQICSQFVVDSNDFIISE